MMLEEGKTDLWDMNKLRLTMRNEFRVRSIMEDYLH